MTMNKDAILQTLSSKAMDYGAFKCSNLPVEDVITNIEFRKICESNSCGEYNRCWTCPPDCGDIHSLINQVRSFKNVFLYQTVNTIEDSFDFEGMQEAKKKHTQLSQALNNCLPSILQQKYLHITAGGCGICERCAKKDKMPCRFPDKALSSLEAFGIDVYQTVKKTELKYINGKGTVTYFGAVFF